VTIGARARCVRLTGVDGPLGYKCFGEGGKGGWAGRCL
jgi:hypothetical protein